MKKLVLASAMLAIFMGTAASAASVTDATGDFLPTYTGPAFADLDVTDFSVLYDPNSMNFTLGAQFAGMIDPALAGFYVIGVNTGTGVIAPFGDLGQGDVIFNQAVVIQKAGTGAVGATALAAGAVTISGNSLSAIVPLSLLPSTGFSPGNYGFNIWPRTGPDNELVSDFSPENATLAAAVPEPQGWAMMLLGFLSAGAMLRGARRRRFAPARA